LSESLKLAVAGVGNNISALLQGVQLYRRMLDEGVAEDRLPGVTRSRIGGLRVCDVDFVAAFEVDQHKVGKDLSEAILTGPNNYPLLGGPVQWQDVAVRHGIRDDAPGARRTVAEELRASGAEVLLYSLPTGLQWAAEEYARSAAEAGVAFVNCTPESIARSPEFTELFAAVGAPLVGDDLASHLGSSVLHRSLLRLFADRGITLRSSYQLNFGGNEDFRNLRERGGSKRQSKLNALAQDGVDLAAVEIIPSAGYVPQLGDHKVAMLNVEGVGWGNTPVELDLKLKVQDSSNAAGVIIDLIRIAAAARRSGITRFPAAAARVLKSPPGGHRAYGAEAIRRSELELEPFDVETSGR
jgi:myo-inositol-1-phosphate synthase